MIYTITAVLPAQITVIYSDGSVANVPIDADFTQAEIDDAVSQYDPEFLPDPATLINPLVSVGQTSASDPLPVGVGSTAEVEGFIDQDPLSGTITYLADYFTRVQGNTTVRDALDAYVFNVVGLGTTLSPVGFVSHIEQKQTEQLAAGVQSLAFADEIFNLALDELAEE